MVLMEVNIEISLEYVEFEISMRHGNGDEQRELDYLVCSVDVSMRD